MAQNFLCAGGNCCRVGIRGLANLVLLMLLAALFVPCNCAAKSPASQGRHVALNEFDFGVRQASVIYAGVVSDGDEFGAEWLRGVVEFLPLVSRPLSANGKPMDQKNSAKKPEGAKHFGASRSHELKELLHLLSPFFLFFAIGLLLGSAFLDGRTRNKQG